MPPSVVIAVDVGNSQVKFCCECGDRLRRWSLPAQSPALTVELSRWLEAAIPEAPETDADEFPRLPASSVTWWISSVNPAALQNLADGILHRRPADRWRVIESTMIPLADRLRNRASTGVDRLLVAWFAPRYLGGTTSDTGSVGGAGTIVVDAGSAVTVDWVDAEGVFRGGMIYPGFGLSAQALNRGTAALPLVDGGEQPLGWASERGAGNEAVGDETVSAIRAGIYWSQWGALRGAVEVLQEQAQQITRHEAGRNQWPITAENPAAPAVIVTGGGIRAFAERLPATWRWEPDLMARAILQLASLEAGSPSSNLR